MPDNHKYCTYHMCRTIMTRTRVAAMLAPVHVLLVQPEEGVRDDAGAGGVAEAGVDEGHGQGADQQAKAQTAEA
jgi:hypothetical protein